MIGMKREKEKKRIYFTSYLDWKEEHHWKEEREYWIDRHDCDVNVSTNRCIHRSIDQ